MKKIILSLIVLALIIPSISLAHPGRTDASGCHTCRTNCSSWGLSTGEYHCHNAKVLLQPKEPIKSTYGENGTGYTTPAPEYKAPKTSSETIKKTNTITPPIKTDIKPVVDPVKENIEGTTNIDSYSQQIINSEPKEEKKSWVSRFFNWLF